MRLIDADALIDSLNIRSATYNHIINKCIEDAPTIEAVDCSEFIEWILDEIMDEENWEYNAVANGEIIARKLKKLGLLEVKDGYYVRTPSYEALEVVRCKDCRWYDSRDVCHNPRYGDGHANYSQPYVDEEYWCKDGERKGGDNE